LVAAAAVLGASVLIGAAPASASGPTAGLSIEPAAGELAVQLVADSAGFSTPVVSYKWNFGDGQTAKTTVNHVTHTYPAARTFKPTVTEKNAGGQKATAAATLALFNCPTSSPCNEALSHVGTVQSLQVSGATIAGMSASVNLLVGQYKIKHCETSISPGAAFTDSGFAGPFLTATLVYTTTVPNPLATTCFASTVPFKNSVGATVTSGALPPCQASNPAPPCVQSESQMGSQVTKVLLVPPGDPKVGAP
jgi:hypothetical protein